MAVVLIYNHLNHQYINTLHLNLPLHQVWIKPNDAVL